MGGKCETVNLTLHELNIYDSEGEAILSIPPPKDVPIPRVSVSTQIVENININGVEVPIRKVVYGDVESLPPLEEVRYMSFQPL